MTKTVLSIPLCISPFSLPIFNVYCFGQYIFSSQTGSTALIQAAERGRADCVRLLLDAGADKNAHDKVRRQCCALLCMRLFVSYLPFIT